MISRRFFNRPGWGGQVPFEEFFKVRGDVDRMADAFFGRQGSSAGVFPLVNLTEDKDYYRIRAELPGMVSSDLDISVTGKNLAISGERKIEAEGEVKYHRREREAGKFNRMITLPGEVEAGNVEAKLSDGILKITLPKAEGSKPRQIKVG